MIAFVRFALRSVAEFTKEAMADQTLGFGDILNIRWSNEDPNPTAKRYENEELSRKASAAIIEKSKDMGVPDYMLAEHVKLEGQAHPYSRTDFNSATGELEGDWEQPADLQATQQYYLQWAQFFAQQGIDPSQLDESTINYYQQYYSFYYNQVPYYSTADDQTKAITAPPPSTSIPSQSSVPSDAMDTSEPSPAGNSNSQNSSSFEIYSSANNSVNPNSSEQDSSSVNKANDSRRESGLDNGNRVVPFTSSFDIFYVTNSRQPVVARPITNNQPSISSSFDIFYTNNNTKANLPSSNEKNSAYDIFYNSNKR